MMNRFSNPFPQMPMRSLQTGINSQQFFQWLPQINNNMLQQLILQARQQGISEQDIQAGLNIINSMRSRG